MFDPKKKFNELIKETESVYLDFKEKYHDKNDDLLHDILCLSNSDHSGDRYIVYGINDSRERIGLAEEPSHSVDGLIQFLQGSGINKTLHNYVELFSFEQDGKYFALLRIKNVPLKPFFLLKKIKNIQAGAIYTRHGSKNTDKDKTATDDEVLLMWRERFGLDRKPLDKVLDFLDDTENWKRLETGRESDFHPEFYFEYSPEFRISFSKTVHKFKNMEEITSTERESIPPNWKNGTAIYKNVYRITYLGQTLIEAYVWEGDDCRELIPLPEISDGGQGRYIERSSINYKLCLVLARNKPSGFDIDDLINRAGIELV